MNRHHLAAAALSACALAQAQTLPPPPVSPVPVTRYEYDAQGHPTKTIQAPGVSGFGFETKARYDTLSRVKDTTDPQLGLTQFGYNDRADLTQVTDPRNLVTQYPRNGLGDATSLISPDTGTATHTYDAAGNLTARTDSRGVLSTHTYDVLNRLTQSVHSKTGLATQTFGWAYDQTGTGFAYGVDRLTSTTFPAGSSQHAYSPQGQITVDTQRVSAATGANSTQISTVVTYAYTNGQLTSITYPSGRKLTLSYTNAQLTGLSLAKDGSSTATPLVSQIQYEPFGPPSSWLWQMGSSTQAHTRVFDTSGRAVRYTLGASVRDLTYDAADRITNYTHYNASTAAAQPSLNQAFAYDQNGRLTGVTANTSSWSIGYDANGNRTGVTLNGTTSAYTTQATSNRLTSTTNPSRTLGYDSAGNTTSDSGYTATYDAAGRLATITKAGVTTTYSYNGQGQRVRKFSSTGATSTVIFVYDPSGQLLGEYSNTGAPIREYVWLGDIPIAMFVPNGTNPPTVFYFHTDHLNTPRVVVNTAGGIRWRWMAEPFGTTAPETNPSGLGAFTQNLRFPGQYADSESGLFYNYFRNYDSSLGRYNQFDLIGLAGGSLAGYDYVNGNPVSYADPNGLQAAAVVPTPMGPVLMPLPIAPLPQPLPPRADDISPPPLGPQVPSLPDLTLPGIPVMDAFRTVSLIGQALVICATANNDNFWQGLKPYRGKTKTNGESGKKRRFYEWDHTHDDVEVYDGRGNHLGSANPTTGEMTKPPVPGRRINI